MDARDIRNEKTGKAVVKALNARFFEAYYCATREEAADKALEMIAEGSTVTWGGSMSIFECGLVDKLKAGKYNIIDRALCKPEEKNDIMRKAFFADTYLMSANAISADGQLVNIDGTGNRLAALCFGPKQVIVIAGINKIAPDLDSAMKRASGISAPINAQRFELNTPCKLTGICTECRCADSICSQILVTRMNRNAGRIKVIICGDELGF